MKPSTKQNGQKVNLCVCLTINDQTLSITEKNDKINQATELKMCRLMVALNSSPLTLACNFEETFAYLVKVADVLLSVTHSCFGYVRDCSSVADDDLPGDKSCLVAILNECLDQSLR